MHPRLPPGIVFDVGAIVVEEVALNLDLARLIEESKFIRPQIGVIAFHVGIASDMTRPRRLQRQQRSEEHTSELQSRGHLVCRLLLEKKKEYIRKNLYFI